MKIFADGLTVKEARYIIKNNKAVKGFTTNPSLMRKAKVKDYEAYGKQFCKVAGEMPVSFEIIADDFETMEEQAQKISTWGKNVYVKIPITNTKGESSANLMDKLSGQGIKINATAIFTLEQVKEVSETLLNRPSIISIFAGRIADTGINPFETMYEALDYCSEYPEQEVLWASVRELYNVREAYEVGCHICTVGKSILDKMDLVGKDLNEFSLSTVKMFYSDAVASGYTL